MAVLNGTLYLMSIGGNVMAKSQNATLTRNVETANTTTKDSAGNAEHIQTTRSWSGSFDGLYDPDETYDPKTIGDLMDSRSTASIVFESSDSATGTLIYTGTASFTDLELSAPVEDVMTWSASFTGTGALVTTLAS